jgi:adenine-specific DNA methylase
VNFIVNETAQKLRGGYYTPLPLTIFLTKYVLHASQNHILEPSCGDGAFFRALSAVGSTASIRVTGIELNKDEAQKANKELKKQNLHGMVISADFLQWYLDHRNENILYDGIVGNPPFIRYQYLPEKMQELSSNIFANLGLKFTKHTNAWIPFILASMELLKPEGYLGMVVPSEIFNVIYAQSLREYLGKQCSEITIIDPEDLWFESTLQGAVLLLAKKKKKYSDSTKGLGVLRVKGFDFCDKDPDYLLRYVNRINGNTIGGKWTAAFLSEKEHSLLQKIKANNLVRQFSDIASVDVGIVTGANDFFLVNQEIVKKYDLQEFSYPMFGRSGHCPGILYTKNVHQINCQNGLPSSFLWIKKEMKALSKKQREYIALGENQVLHTRYKCRIRQPWYTVPSVYATKIGMLKRSHDIPRLILNQANALTTDTSYRITADYIDNELFVFSFINSLTALSAEIEGRSYGGGVLELVPSEINKLLIPVPKIKEFDLQALDGMVRSDSPEQYLIRQDKVILGNIGITEKEQHMLYYAWLKLRNRRQRKPISNQF